jgi:putative chitinase
MQLLKPGTQNPNVRILKHYLNLLLLPSPSLDESSAKFDDQTNSAVRLFKSKAKIAPADGVVNVQTWGEIGAEFANTLPPNRPEVAVGMCFINGDPLEIPNWMRNLSKVAIDGPLNFDQATFFRAYMEQYGAIKESASRGLNEVLKFIDLDPAVVKISWAAYMMATVKHECANTWEPIEEYGKGSGHEYGKPVTVKGADGESYRCSYYGRGCVQLTWQKNYERLSDALGLGDDLVIHPERALVPETAYKILSLWMNGGYSANGRRLMEYTLGKTPDYEGARHLVNGTDQPALIAGYAKLLEVMLRAASNGS